MSETSFFLTPNANMRYTCVRPFRNELQISGNFFIILCTMYDVFYRIKFLWCILK